jgi:hypothetical protein
MFYHHNFDGYKLVMAMLYQMVLIYCLLYAILVLDLISAGSRIIKSLLATTWFHQ